MTTELNDKEFILNQDKWPMWPYIPLRRRHNGDIQSGFIQGHIWTVFIGYIFNIGKKQGDTLKEMYPEFIEYNSLDELLADGWMVD